MNDQTFETLKNSVLLGEDGAVYQFRLTTDKVSSLDNLVNAASSRLPVTLPMMQPGTAVSTIGGRTVLASKLYYTLPLNAYWRDKKEGELLFLTPEFEGKAGEYVNKTIPWKVPKNHAAMLSVVLTCSTTDPGAPPNVTASSLQFITGNKLIVPPLTNLYFEMGALCTGEIAWNGRNGLDNLIDSYFESWSANRWNADLMLDLDRDAWEKLIRIDAVTEETLTPDVDWHFYESEEQEDEDRAVRTVCSISELEHMPRSLFGRLEPVGSSAEEIRALLSRNATLLSKAINNA